MHGFDYNFIYLFIKPFRMARFCCYFTWWVNQVWFGTPIKNRSWTIIFFSVVWQQNNMYAQARQRLKTNWMCLIRCITRFRSKRFRFIRSFDRTMCDCDGVLVQAVNQNPRIHGGVSFKRTYGAHKQWNHSLRCFHHFLAHRSQRIRVQRVWNISPTHIHRCRKQNTIVSV